MAANAAAAETAARKVLAGTVVACASPVTLQPLAYTIVIMQGLEQVPLARQSSGSIAGPGRHTRYAAGCRSFRAQIFSSRDTDQRAKRRFSAPTEEAAPRSAACELHAEPSEQR